jgi:hypothetical protein
VEGGGRMVRHAKLVSPALRERGRWNTVSSAVTRRYRFTSALTALT